MKSAKSVGRIIGMLLLLQLGGLTVPFILITVMLHFTGIPLPLFLGYPSVTLMGATMGLSHIALALWLMAKGFEERLPSQAAL